VTSPAPTAAAERKSEAAREKKAGSKEAGAKKAGSKKAASKKADKVGTDKKAKAAPAKEVVKAAAAADKKEEDCRMAVTDDACYKNVVWAMTDGIKKHPKWYKGLTEKSLFEDFQLHLSSDKNSTCPKPCKISNCETAAAGSECWENAQWAMTKGLKDHPDWYKGLTNESTVEDFQTHIYEGNKTLCPKPACNAQPFKAISFFCWAVVRAEGYELGLVQAQLKKKAGIFACDDYAVISDKALDLDGVKVLQISSTSVGGFTDAGTSPNAPVFVEAWGQIKADGRYKAHDWVVKCDPDTVLIPDRLRLKLTPGKQPSDPYPPPFKPAPGAGQWVTNCDKMAGWGAGWGHGWPMMYGSVEIISREAIDNYFANEEMCKNSFAWQGMGEDAFMGLCLRKLKTGELFMKQGDGVCGGGGCEDASFQAYHPHKDITSWMQCWATATR